jgi:hypothetical protein
MGGFNVGGVGFVSQPARSRAWNILEHFPAGDTENAVAFWV